VEVSFSELLKGIPPTGESYFLGAKVKLRDGRRYEVSGQALKYRPEGLEIVRSWRAAGKDETGESAETPSWWTFHPWEMVEEIEFQEVWISGHGKSTE
jgi:hypothetical protein